MIPVTADEFVYLLVLSRNGIEREEIFRICYKFSKAVYWLNDLFRFRDETRSESVSQALTNLNASGMIYMRSDKPTMYFANELYNSLDFKVTGKE